MLKVDAAFVHVGPILEGAGWSSALGSGWPGCGEVVAGFVVVRCDEPWNGRQELSEHRRFRSGAGAPERHDGCQVAQFLSEQQAIKLPLGDNERLAGSNPCVRRVEARVTPECPDVLGLGCVQSPDVDHYRAVALEPRDNDTCDPPLFLGGEWNRDVRAPAEARIANCLVAETAASKVLERAHALRSRESGTSAFYQRRRVGGGQSTWLLV
jgi:hypothetical protein